MSSFPQNLWYLYKNKLYKFFKMKRAWISFYKSIAIISQFQKILRNVTTDGKYICVIIFLPVDKFSSVQSLSHVWLFATPWTAARQAVLSITNSRSLLKLMSIESVMPSHDLILCRPLLLPPSIFPSIGVFSDESGSCHVPLELFLQSKHLEIFTTP